jgi:hypothetical protein
MRIDPNGVYVACMSFVGDYFTVRKGQRLRGDNAAVQAVPQHFIPAEGATDDAMAERVRENELAAANLSDKKREAALEAARKVGARWLPTDDATAESAKREVRKNDDLELIWDSGGVVIGLRLRESVKERYAKQAQEAASREGEANRAALAAVQERREA